MNVEETLTTASQILEAWAWKTETTRPAPTRIDATLENNDDLVPLVVALRVKQLGYLAAITGLDHGPEAGFMEALYHFSTGPVIVTLRLKLPREGAEVQTLSDIIPSAEPFERELSEMFGVMVVGLPNPDHLYLPEGWPEGVYPLRKDFDPSVLGGNGHHTEADAS
jgi:Ni,Fe-hydrogenase III component G